MTSIRKLLDEHNFDWKNGVVVVPSGKGSSKNVFIGPDHVALDVEFELNYREAETNLPIFTAEDPGAMYFLCDAPESGFSTFHKVEALYLRSQSLEGIRGYPFGTTINGIDLSFATPLEVFVTIPSHVPAFVGCPEIHFYCVSTDLKGAMDLFTTRILSGYMRSRSKEVEGEEGYAKVLNRFFGKLKVVT